jgi:hypothetical protein
VVIFSMPCEGTLDYDRVKALLGDYVRIDKLD